MKQKTIIITLIVALLAIIGTTSYFYFSEATCSKGKNCTACSNCKYCKNCSKDGGTCSVCE